MVSQSTQGVKEPVFQSIVTGFIDSVIPSQLSTNAKLFLTGAVVNGVSNGVFNSVLQLYLISMGFSVGAMGRVFMFNPLTCAVLAIPCGIMADRYGKRKMIIFGFIAVCIGVTGMFLSRSIYLLGFSFAMFGVSNATSTVMMPLYSSFYEKQDMEKAIGLYGLINISAMSLGNLTGHIPTYMINQFSFTDYSAYRLVMMAAASLFILQYIFYLASSRDIKEKLSDVFSFKLKSWRPVVKFSGLTLLLNVAGAILFSFFPYYVNQKFGVTSAGLGTLFFISNLTMAVSKGMAASIAKRLGNMRSIVAGVALSSVFFFLMPLSPSFGLLSLLYVLRSGTRFMSDPILTSLFLKSINEDEQSTANSIRMIAMNGSGAVSSLIGGFLLENVGLDSPAYIGAALTLVLAGLFPLLLSKEIDEAS